MALRKAKGIGLLSGGLDSILAVKVLQEQDLDLMGVTFTTPFFGPEAGLAAARAAQIPMQVVDIGEVHLAMLKKPVYGYGSQMNPCIDCHALMLQQAGIIMEQVGADFLFTGEVLGQRPMSQRRDALRSVEKLAGLPGRVLRPLSARLLAPTVPEMDGLVDRSKLLDVQGRGRKRQMALVEKYGITDYPQPGGGCMLTKEGFGKRLRALLQDHPEAGLRQVELLKWGRHFRLPTGAWLAIGRNEADNRQLGSLAAAEDVVFNVFDCKGPTGLVMQADGSIDHETLRMSAAVLASYSDAPLLESVSVSWSRGSDSGTVAVAKTDKEHFKQHLL